MKFRAVLLLACAVAALPACAGPMQPQDTAAQNSTAVRSSAGTTRLASTAAAPPSTFPQAIKTAPGTAKIAREETTQNELTQEARANAAAVLSAAQVAAFYNAHANAIKKAEKITVHRHDLRTTQVRVPAVLQKLAPDILRSVYPDKDETVTATFVHGRGRQGDINDFMPVSGSEFVSRLRAGHVQSAGRTAEEGGWRIRIALKDEPLDLDTLRENAGGIDNLAELDRRTITDRILLQSGYGSCMDMAFIHFFQEGGKAPGSFDLRTLKASGMLRGGRITAFVDRDGRMASLTLSYTCEIEAKYLGMKIRLRSISRQEYSFNEQ